VYLQLANKKLKFFFIENLVQSIQNFERYHPKFKYAEKMDANKLPNSIKTTRSNALPNTKVINDLKKFNF